MFIIKFKYNLMKILFLLIVLVKSNLLYSQNLIIEYDVKYNQSIYKNKLIIYDTITEWEDIISDETSNTQKLFLIKKPLEGKLFLSDFIFNKLFYVKDSLHNMKWELTNEKKVILNEKCNSAKTNFRGRIYTAYYSNSISQSDGPWKFGGLPGMILEVKSDDNSYEFSAYEINKNPIKKDVSNVNTKLKFLTWQEFTKQFKLTVDNTIKMVKTKTKTTDNDIKGYIKIDAPEIIYPKAQIGEGVEY